MTNQKPVLRTLFDWLLILLIFLIGLWLIVIQPLGPNLSRLPGNLGDTRFNNYILEHDFRWINGQDSSLWNAPFFYPYPRTLAFSDNHLGSMLFYDVFRWSGLDRESSMQAWYLLSYFLNFSAAALILMRYKLKPLAVGLGAFFYTFGLPVLAQEGHVQLAYRFCIPFATYSLWQFSQQKHLKHLVFVLFWQVWQFYLSIYLGFFLSLLLIALAIGLSFIQNGSIIGILRYWPNLIKQAWKNSKIKTNIFYLFLISTLLFTLFLLFQPYVVASNTYGLSRSWQEISQMLPRIQSYLISDYSRLWQPLAYLSSQVTTLRWEHQLFIGLSAIILLFLGLVWRFKSPYKKIAFLFLGAAISLILLTIYIKGFSMYKILWYLPGVNSVRAVTRIILLLMWPIALFISIVADALLRISNKILIYSIIILLLLSLMIAESVFYNHDTFLKADAYARIQTLRKELPISESKDPILFVWNPDNDLWYLNELDAMMLSQDIGWPVLNGYSGNMLDGYGPTKDCDQAVARIIRYMNFEQTHDVSFYKNLISRVVTVGPEECRLPNEMSIMQFSKYPGSFSQELFSGVSINIISLTKKEDFLFIQVDIENNSSQTLPAESSTGNPFSISWRITDANDGNPVSDFDTRKYLSSDIPAGSHALMTIIAAPPTIKGKFNIEVSAVQENIAWFHDRGMDLAKSTQIIIVNDLNQWIISN
jgi:hypothetical protein